MTIELTENEVMWIIDKVSTECVKGTAAIAGIGEPDDDDLKKAVNTAKEVVKALAELGLKLTKAMTAELDKQPNN
jgi:hypothetical protein